MIAQAKDTGEDTVVADIDVSVMPGLRAMWGTIVIGVLIFAMIRVPHSNAEFLAVVLGSIAFASGLAGYLGLSPIVVSRMRRPSN